MTGSIQNVETVNHVQYFSSSVLYSMMMCCKYLYNNYVQTARASCLKGDLEAAPLLWSEGALEAAGPWYGPVYVHQVEEWLTSHRFKMTT